MNVMGGVISFAIGVVMLILAKPKDGVSARFLKGPWIVGQAYVMIAMIFGGYWRFGNYRELAFLIGPAPR
jgi:hypothetical protein